jgi:putative oxidoreductase
MEMFVLAGQAIIGIVYILGAVSDIIDREVLLQMLQRKRIPYENYLLPGAIGLKIVCGLALIFNILTPVAAFFLAGFTLIANVIFHPFWISPANERKKEYFAFVFNMAIIGGLMVIVGR